MRLFLILILFFLFNCSSRKISKSNNDIDVAYIKEITKYSNFKSFLNRDLDCKTDENNFVYGKNDSIGKEYITKCHYQKNKELVFVEFSKESGIYVKQKFYYRKNELVHIKSLISTNKKDTLLNRIFVKDNTIYYNSNPKRDSTYLLNKGLNYINNFSLNNNL